MFFARKVSVFTILSYVFSVGFVFAADTTVTSKQYVDNQLLKKINLETGAGISAGDMLRATVDTNDANKMKWLAWTPDYITSSMLNDYLTITAAANTYQTKITSDNKLLSDLVDDTNQTHKFVTASEKSTWNAKQNAISDLATIRSGASAGATAVQPGDLADVATSGSYNDLTDKPTIPTDTDTTYTFAEGSTDGAFSVTPSGGSAQSVPVHGWADKEDVINKKNDIDAVWVAGLTSAQKAAYYPTVGAVHERLKNYALVNDLASKVDKVVAVDKKKLISRNKDGLAGPAPSDDVDVADDGSFTVKHAVTADSATTATTATTAGTANSVAWANVTNKQTADANNLGIGKLYTSTGTATDGSMTRTAITNALAGKAASSHNHPTSDVNLLTGYSKPNSTSALATTDTLNAALGKLEKALDGKAASSHNHDGVYQPVGNYVTRSGTTAVGSATQPVYVNASGVATATTYTLGASVPAGAVFTDSVTTVTNSDGTAGGNTAVAGSIKVTKDGATTYPVVQGWANKQDKITSSNKLSADLVSGLHAVATSGNYNDLTNKPTIPTVPGVFTGATASANGTSGLVKQPLVANRNQFLKGDGNWASITKSDVGLGNVDNTSDADKPISTATQTALENKVPTTRTVNGHALSSDITLSASDVGAQPAGDYASSSHNHDSAYVAKTQTTKGGVLTTNATTGAVEVSSTIAQSKVTNLTTDLAAKVPTTRTVNGHALSSDITLSASDVGAQPAGNYAASSHNHDGTYVKTAQGATNSGKLLKVNASGNLELFTPSYATSTHNHDTAYVPLTRTVNGKALSANISLSPTDIGAAASTHSHPTSQVDALTGYAKGSSSAALATTDTLNAALGKLENKADNAATAASNAATAASNAATAAATAQSTADSKMSVPSATATGQLLQATVSNGTTTWSAFTPSYATTGDLSAKVDTTVAGDANSLMIRNTSGVATKPTSSDVTVSGTTVTIANNAVTSAKIADGTIMNADVASNAAIAQSKIANLTTDLAAKVPIAQGAGNANKALVVDSSGNVTSGAVKVPITDFSGTGGWAQMWID